MGYGISRPYSGDGGEHLITDVIAYTVVIWACMTVVSRVYKMFTKRSACDGCSCKQDTPMPAVIPLELRFTKQPSTETSKLNHH
jgi:hypothetical protein